MPRSRWLLVLLVMVGRCPAVAGSDAPDSVAARRLLARCASCHGLGPEDDDPAGGLDLSRRESALIGGDSGPALVPGDPGASLLVRRVESGKMPPKPHAPLAAADVAALREWVRAGAPWGPPIRRDETEAALAESGPPGAGLWSLRPIADPAPPPVRQRAWVRDPIDAFILAGLEADGLTPAPEADRATYIRRVTFDLIGLPPTPEEVAAFEADVRPDAYERLVDRLLASPQHGERWGRHWLDLARFAESHGFEYDRLREHAWPYRDYVIGRLNADVPYDRFVAEQLAGDLLDPGSAASVAATGFLVAGPWDEVGNLQQSTLMKARVREEELEDMIAAVGQTFLGLTVNCARCHDHKFDPIPQRDYYRLKAALEGVRHGNRPLPGTASAGEKPPQVYAASPTSPPPTPILARGDAARPGEVVAAGGLAAVPGPSADFGLVADAPEASRRRKLAEWVTHPDNPLTPRVAVNRVWQYHFGAGIVGTPSDFGANGEAPTHPELLDRLARDFREAGGRLKPLHRRIVLSATYRQSSRHDPAAAAVDAEARRLWRFPPRRLEGEAVRDAMLAAAGRLNPRMGGPGYRPFVVKTFNSNFYEMIPDPSGPEFDRRTVYRMQVNSARSPLLEALDCPDPSVKTPRRAVTTTPLQALGLMNDPFAIRMARELAARAAREAGDDHARQAERAYRLALGRAPRPSEAGRAADLIRREGLESLAWVLFNANEFLTIR